MSPTMPIELDRTSSEPLYRQVATAVRRAIDDGRLRSGQRVPSVRVLAAQLGVGRLTIATAYEQLAAEGYVVSRMGFGTIVAPQPPDVVTRDAPFGPRPGGPRSLHELARFDLRSSAAAGWSGTGGDGGLAVGPTLERLLRDEFRRVA